MRNPLTAQQVSDYLRGSPYTIDAGEDCLKRFRRVYTLSASIQEDAIRVMDRIERDAAKIFETFKVFLRSDLVAESNRIEGYQWSAEQVREAVQTHSELINGRLLSIATALREDRRVLEAIGLYRAHLLADEWVTSAMQHRPVPAEVRAFHAEVASGYPYAGEYKRTANRIGGSSLATTDPLDVPEAIRRLTDWWKSSTADPLLKATVVHAWLTHVHPFEDGNGRVARLLANLELAQSGYPPMILREQADRGQYYDALAASDDGDILPLYDLFAQVLRRTVDTMATPSYVQDIVHEKFLGTSRARYASWLALLDEFSSVSKDAFLRYGWDVWLQGAPSLESFSLLSNGRGSGSGWYLKILDRRGVPVWLLWFGYNSRELLAVRADVRALGAAYPSILFSRRSTDPASIHPFRNIRNSGSSRIPSEVVLLPGTSTHAVVRWNDNSRSCSIVDAATLVADSICQEC